MSSNPDQLILDNLGLVYVLARKYRRFLSVMSYGDIIGYGNLGLVLAAHKYDESREVKFSSFASWWIYGQIQHGAMKFGYVKHHQSGMPTWYKMNSLNAPMDGEDGDEFIDGIEDESSLMNDIDDIIYNKEIYDLCVKNLLPRERKVFYYVYSLGKGITETAKYMEVSKQRVDQLRQRAMEKVKNVFEETNAGLVKYYGNKESPSNEYDEDPENLLFSDEIYDMALSRLTKKEKRVFDLLYNHQMKQVQVAKIMELSNGRVSQLKISIGEKLRDLLN